MKWKRLLILAVLLLPIALGPVACNDRETCEKRCAQIHEEGTEEHRACTQDCMWSGGPPGD